MVLPPPDLTTRCSLTTSHTACNTVWFQRNFCLPLVNISASVNGRNACVPTMCDHIMYSTSLSHGHHNSSTFRIITQPVTSRRPIHTIRCLPQYPSSIYTFPFRWQSISDLKGDYWQPFDNVFYWSCHLPIWQHVPRWRRLSQPVMQFSFNVNFVSHLQT